MNSQEIGMRIKELRMEKGLELGKRYTGKMLADEVGISRSYLGDIESGRATPNQIILSKIADVFDVDLWDIIGNNIDLEIDNTPSKEDLSNQKLNSIIKKIDGNTAIKSWIKDTELKSALLELIYNNNYDLLEELRNNIKLLATNESLDFKKLNNIKPDEYSLEANLIESKYTTKYYNFLVNKIIMLINMEVNKTKSIYKTTQDCSEQIPSNNKTNKLKKEEEIKVIEVPKKEKQIWEEEKEYLMPIASHDKKGDFTEEDYKHDEDIMKNDDLWK